MKQSKSPLRVGKKVFIRGVTNYYTGRIIAITRDEIVLAECAWVADTGRFHASLTSGDFAEVEPYPGVVSIGRGAVCDVTVWPHSLPRAVK